VYKGKNNLEILEDPLLVTPPSPEAQATENFQTQLEELKKEETQELAKIEATISGRTTSGTPRLKRTIR